MEEFAWLGLVLLYSGVDMITVVVRISQWLREDYPLFWI
jgi:hypothetical protein